MHPEDLIDERIGEVLRSHPRWQPPAQFVRTVLARVPASSVAPPVEVPLVPLVLRALEVGGAGALVAYSAGMVLLRATPFLIDNAFLIAWVTGVVTLSVAVAVSGRAEGWI